MLYHLVMSIAVQIFSCPHCKRGGFRSLPGPDGKAHCPWCGDRVAADTAAPPPPVPEVAPTPVIGSPDLSQIIDRVAKDAPEVAVRALRDRLAEVERKCEQAESELRRELDKKQEIKRAVLAEMGQLGSQLSESKALLQRRDEELLSVLLEAKVLKDDLGKERKRADDLAGERGSLEEKGKALRSLEAELEASRKAVRDLQEARDEAGREAQQARSELARAKEGSAVELGELRKKLASGEARLQALKGSGAELKALKALHAEYRGHTEKEQAELLEKTKTLQAELGKRDQRIRELQLLIKTLGERLNDLTSRHF
jgi:chromosome segregation ATPase